MGGDLDFCNSYAQRGNLPVIEHVVGACLTLFPSFGRLKLMRTWGGICDMTMDGSPIIGKLPVRGLYMTGGWCYGGFKATPASGWLHAYTIASDEPHPLNAAFTLERFAQGRTIDEKGAGPIRGRIRMKQPADAALTLRERPPEGGTAPSAAGRCEGAVLLIPCPWCGPRAQIEFTYGGDATLQRPAPDAPEAQWLAYVYVRDNPCGPHDELWLHSRRLPALVQGPPRHAHARDSRERAPRRSAPGSRGVTQPQRLPAGRSRRPDAAAGLRIRRRALRGTRRRHARLRAARQRRAPRRPQLQVSPAARHRRRRRRGTERAGADRARRAHRAQCARDDAGALRGPRRREPELLAVGALRRRRDQRRRRRDSFRPASTTRRSCGRRRRSGGSGTST